MSTLSIPLLKLRNSTTTNAICNHLRNNRNFLTLSAHEGNLIFNRDIEDDKKLAQGIQLAISKNALRSIPPPTYSDIYVDGKTPVEVSKEILDQCTNLDGSTVIVLCGLSGTGKGTTVSQLKKDLANRSVISWSNGNIFRSMTLLCTTWCEKNDKPLLEALSPDNLSQFMSMLTFQQYGSNWDICINGLDLNLRVSEVENTLLKSSLISQSIPTVARETQGEVVTFAAKAIEKMISKDDVVVLLEGRKQTVDYVSSSNRFVLNLKDDSVVGKRRAAQRLMAAVLEREQEEVDIDCILTEELEKLVFESE